MAYATAAELRDRYLAVGVDELAHLSDDELDAALAAASAEIDRWRPAVTLGTAATAALRDICLTLGRLIAHQDQALGDEHPIVREAKEARIWLRALADGRVRLPTEGAAPAAGATWDSVPTVWGRGDGGGLA